MNEPREDPAHNLARVFRVQTEHHVAETKYCVHCTVIKANKKEGAVHRAASF